MTQHRKCSKTNSNDEFFVNEAAVDDRIESPSALFLVNEYAVNESDLIQLSPFGDFPNKDGMQRIRPEDAEAIVNDFDDPFNLEAHGLGLPWYVGHPDFKALEQKYTDREAKGRIKKLVSKSDAACQKCQALDIDDPCRDHGLFAKVRWNDQGKHLIKNEAYHGHSVNWRIKRENGYVRPTSLKSVGFTNDPQIPVEPITQANEKGNNMLKTLTDWIKKLTGKDVTDATVANELDDWYANTFEPMKKKMGDCAANEETATTAIKDCGFQIPGNTPMIVFLANEVVAGRTREASLVNEKQELTTKLEAETGKVTTLTGERDTVANEKKVVNETLVNEKKSRGKLLAQFGVAEGRLSAAQQETFANEAGADPEAAQTRLAAMPKVWNNTTQTKGVGQRSSETIANESARRDRVIQLVNEKQSKEPKLTYEQAFAKVQKENPALFEEMKKPETK